MKASRRMLAIVAALVLLALLAGTAMALFPGVLTTSAISSPAAPSTNTSVSTPTPTKPATYDRGNPETWTNRQLATQTLFFCSTINNLRALIPAVQGGIGGVVFLGGETPSDLADSIAALSAAAGAGVPPMISSDEEGGQVQRLDEAIYELPSAKTMGEWTTVKLHDTAADYATRMRQLGLHMTFAPVADLAIPGTFMDEGRRAFSADPVETSRAVTAWAGGLRDGGVIPVVKHWPGHGHAVDTHLGPATIPAIGQLEKADLLPFDNAISQGFTAVMVGHLAVPGLTQAGQPASASYMALYRLRQQIGPSGLIVTDSLSMGAATAAQGGNIPATVVRALWAGADVALTCTNPGGIEDAVTAAVDSGKISRADMIEKVTRILHYKRLAGILP